MNLDSSNPIHDLIDLPLGRAAGQVDELPHQPPLVLLEHALEVVVDQRAVPVAPRVHPHDFGAVEYLPAGPHQAAVDPNELLPGDGICLVEHASDLIIVVETDGVDDVLELVADVQFVFSFGGRGVRISKEVKVCTPNNGGFDNNTTERTYAHRRAAG